MHNDQFKHLPLKSCIDKNVFTLSTLRLASGTMPTFTWKVFVDIYDIYLLYYLYNHLAREDSGC